MQDISNSIPDPFYILNKNLAGSSPIFFHGLTKRTLDSVKKYGFKSTSDVPTLTLNLNFSLRYCRKSESDIEKIINSGDKEKLEGLIKDLIGKGVLNEDEVENDKSNYWISKVDKYYEETIDIRETGLLFGFHFSKDLIEMPQRAKMYLNERHKYLFGTNEIWNSRQFAFNNNENIKLEDHNYFEIDLNKEFLTSSKRLAKAVNDGNLNKVSYEDYFKEINKSFKIKDSNLENHENLLNSITDQIIESQIIRLLRNAFIGKYYLLGYKLYFDKNGEKVEDPKWYTSQDELNDILVSINSNIYPKIEWSEYVKENTNRIKLLK